MLSSRGLIYKQDWQFKHVSFHSIFLEMCEKDINKSDFQQPYIET